MHPAAYGPWDGEVEVSDFLSCTLEKKFVSQPDDVAKLPALALALGKYAKATDMSDLLQAPRCQLDIAATDVYGTIEGPLIANAIVKHMGTRNAPHVPPGRESTVTISIQPHLQFGQPGKHSLPPRHLLTLTPPVCAIAGAGQQRNDPNFPECKSKEHIHKSELVWPPELHKKIKKHFADFSDKNLAKKKDVQKGLRMVATYLLNRFGVSPVRTTPPFPPPPVSPCE